MTVDFNNIVLAIISVSAIVSGISGAYTLSLWNRLKRSIANLESPYPLEAEVAQREIHTVLFTITPQVISIFLLSINSVFGLIMLAGQFISPYCTFIILLFIFCTGLYSFLIPFLVVLKDDFILIRLHEEAQINSQGN